MGRGESPIDEYLANVPDDMRGALKDLRATITAASPDATEVISYQMPAFKYKGRSLVGFAAFKKHCSFFPMSAKVLDVFAAELSSFRTSKGTLQFTPDGPIPAPVVRKIVKARMQEIDARTKSAR
ncbi:MAG: hypothetical protein QOC87_1899 [Actinomycetota bacterium]|nr:hypothetical protein [Actinomycetota bacterium]